MRRALQLGLVLMVLGGRLPAGEVVDRVLVHVNHRVVLQSEFEDALRYQALSTGRVPGAFSAAERHEAFEDLVDQALIEEQIAHSNYIPATKDDVARQIREIRRQLPGADPDDSWRAMLERYGLSAADFEACVARSLNILRYLDARFRPLVHVDRRQMETYYREQFLPVLRKRGGQDVPLDQVAVQIEEILVQQEINDATSDWLEELRKEANLPPHAKEPEP